MSNQDNIERAPMYYMWRHIDIPYRTFLIHQAFSGMDFEHFNYEQMALAEWIDIPDHIRDEVMKQLRFVAEMTWKDLNKTNRPDETWRFKILQEAAQV